MAAGGFKMLRPWYFALTTRTLLVGSLFASLSIWATDKPATRSGPSVRVARGGRPQASSVLGEAAGELGKFAATELQRYLRTLSGAEIAIIAEGRILSRPAQEGLILVGGPASNRSIREAAEARWVNFSGLKPEGFVVRTGVFKGHPGVVVVGNTDVSAL